MSEARCVSFCGADGPTSWMLSYGTTPVFDTAAFFLPSGFAAENNRCTRNELANMYQKHFEKNLRHKPAAGVLSNHYNMSPKDDTKIGRRAMTPIGG